MRMEVRKNRELETYMTKIASFLETIKRGGLRRVGHTIRRRNSRLRVVLDQNQVGKKSLGIQKLVVKTQLQKGV